MAANTDNNKKNFDFSLPEKAYQALNEYMKQVKGYQNAINLEYEKTIDKSKKYAEIQSNIAEINDLINKKQSERNKLIEKELDFTNKIEEISSEIKKIEEQQATLTETKLEKTKILKDLAFAQEAYTKNNNLNNKELLSNLNGQLKTINAKLKNLKDEDKLNKDKKSDLQYQLRDIENQKKAYEDSIKIQLDGLNESISLKEKDKKSLEESLNVEKNIVVEQVKRNKLADDYSKIWTEKISNAFTKGISKSASFYLEQEQATTKIAQSWGLSNDELNMYRKNIFNVAPEITTLYGKSAKDIVDIQQGYSSAIGRNIQLGKDDLIAMSQIARVLGSNEAAEKMTANMERFGLSAKASNEFIEKTINLAKKSGVNTIQTLNKINDNLNIASSFSFKGGLDEFSKMEIFSQKMRINMSEVAKLASNVASPETAIQVGAKLQVLGGQFAANSSPMDLLYESLNDMASLTKRYQKMTEGLMNFNKKTGEISFNSPSERLRLQYASQAMGVDYEELIKTAQTSTKRKAIETSPGFSALKGLDEATRENILSKAQWNVKQQTFQVTAGGKTVDIKDVNKLTKEDLEFLKPKDETLGDIASATMSIKEKFDALFAGGMGRIAQLLENFGIGGIRKTLDDIAKDSKSHPVLQGFVGLLGSTNVTNMLLGTSNLLLTGILRATLAKSLGTDVGSSILKDFGEGGFGKAGKGILGRAGKFLASPKGIGLAGGLFSGYEAYSSSKERGESTGTAINRGIFSGVGSGLGAWGGAGLGASIGTAILPGIGTAIGGLIGGFAGGMGGSYLGGKTGNLFLGEQKVQDAFISSQGSRIITPNGKVVSTHKDDDIFALKRGSYNQNQNTLLNSMSALGVAPVTPTVSPYITPKPIGDKPVIFKETYNDNGRGLNNYSSNSNDHNININMSGTIELKAGNQKVDLKELLNNNDFIKQLTDKIGGQIVRADNGGRYKGNLNRHSIRQ